MEKKQGFFHLLNRYDGGLLGSFKFLLPDSQTLCCKQQEAEVDSDTDTEFRMEQDSEDSEPSVDGETAGQHLEPADDEHSQHEDVSVEECEESAPATSNVLVIPEANDSAKSNVVALPTNITN